MTYRNYYLIFLTSILLSLLVLVIDITGVLSELHASLALLDAILIGFGVFLFTVYFMTDSRTSQLINIVPLKNYLILALLIGFTNSYFLENAIIDFGVNITELVIFGAISIKYLDKRMQMDFVGLGIIYLFLLNLISMVLLIIDLVGIGFTGRINFFGQYVTFTWILYTVSRLILCVSYLFILTVKGSQMPEVADGY